MNYTDFSKHKILKKLFYNTKILTKNVIKTFIYFISVFFYYKLKYKNKFEILIFQCNFYFKPEMMFFLYFK